MNILGISAFYHDSAICLVENGDITLALQEERFTRKKHDSSFPINAIKEIKKDIDYVVFYEKPLIKFDRILETYLSFAPWGIGSFLKSMPLWIKQKLWIKNIISKEFNCPVLFMEHHEAHAASAFFPSPFQESAFLTVDGVGEWATASYGIGKDNRINILGELSFPHSLGLLYSAFTYYLGFKVNDGEYKVMGLAPYGKPKYRDLIYELIKVNNDGSFEMDGNYFNYCVGLTMTNRKFDRLFGNPRREPETEINQFHKDIASSIQSVTEDIMLKMVDYVYNETRQSKLCLAGGVAMNCVANGRILRESKFDDVWVQPAAGDAGGALGAALSVWYQYLNNPRETHGRDKQCNSLLGNEYNNQDILEFLFNKGISPSFYSTEALVNTVANLVNDQRVIGLFQGRMEYGARALGNRSIIADARNPDMQKTLNMKIKFRESFRPFAPAILEEKASEYFDISYSPYMLFTCKVKKRGFPAITHVDGSARVQTVSAENGLLYYILKSMDKKYGCPMVINTSFNVRGEPIVNTPGDAYKCFLKTEMDYLVMGNFLVSK